MVANQRIAEMKANMRRMLAWKEAMEDCRMNGKPVSMCVSFHDGPGIQFLDAEGKPLLPEFFRDEELAITVWNALTDNAPIDPKWFE
jgi:hypothetical protein